MFAFLHLLSSFFARCEPRHDIEDAYLADAVDIYDLERRMRALDERAHLPMSGIAFGLYTR